MTSWSWWTFTCAITLPVRQGEVSLLVGTNKYSVDLAEREFGEQMVEFSIPEFTKPEKG